MKALQPYLFFDGNCREAVTFYGQAFGIEPVFMNFVDMPNCPEGTQDRVMHAAIRSGDALLMASDVMPRPGKPFVKNGDSFSVSIDCESPEEQDKLYAALGEGGLQTMPLQDMFWNARFGTLVDKFGVEWMLNFDKGKGL